jgi:uncharacterized membrane protein YedE/YeeE
MSVGASLFVIAAGAILRYAVKWQPGDIKLDTAGLILMIVGIIGLILSLMWMFWPADRRRVPPAP